MMNYIKSELYRALNNKNLKILIGLCAFLMTALVLVLKYFSKVSSFPYANTKFALSNIYMQMTMLILATILFSAFIHDNEDRNHTIKHSVAFGIKRSVIYMGRFITQAVVSILIYLVLVSWFTVLSFCLLSYKNVGELQSLIRVSLGSFTSLLAALAITHFFLMNLENQNTAYLGAISVLVIIPNVLNMLGRKIEVFHKLADLFPYRLVSYNGPLVFVKGSEKIAILKVFLIGGVWLAMFLWLGVMKFNKKEIK